MTFKKKDDQEKKCLTRRQFIKSTAAGAAVLYVAPTLALSTGENSRVVQVKHDNLISSEGIINKKNARESVDKALLMLTRKGDIKDAWMTIFPDLKEKDTIGLKVNCVNKKCPTHPEVAYAIAESLVDATGLNPNNIIIWDRTESELKRTGYVINNSDIGIRCIGTVKKFSIPRYLLNQKMDETGGIGYDMTRPVDMGKGKTSHLSKILTQMCTYLINVPVLKDHILAGVTLSLKNHFGTIDNPMDFHDSYGDPYIAKLNAAPQIKDKTKLVICDAALGVYEGGPRKAPQWQEKALIISTDPVALDYTGMQIINAKREENSMDSVSDMAVHLWTAQKLGLGVCDPDRIEKIEA